MTMGEMARDDTGALLLICRSYCRAARGGHEGHCCAAYCRAASARIRTTAAHFDKPAQASQPCVASFTAQPFSCGVSVAAGSFSLIAQFPCQATPLPGHFPCLVIFPERHRVRSKTPEFLYHKTAPLFMAAKPTIGPIDTQENCPISRHTLLCCHLKWWNGDGGGEGGMARDDSGALLLIC